MKIISTILILVTVFFSFKHGWTGLTMNMKPEGSEMFAALGLNKTAVYIICSLTLAVGVLVLFPQTFVAACILNAILILCMLLLQLKAGNMKAALIEIPFLLLPLVMIYLGHPLKK
jgi:hypothetical protein